MFLDIKAGNMLLKEWDTKHISVKIKENIFVRKPVDLIEWV